MNAEHLDHLLDALGRDVQVTRSELAILAWLAGWGHPTVRAVAGVIARAVHTAAQREHPVWTSELIQDLVTGLLTDGGLLGDLDPGAARDALTDALSAVGISPGRTR
ncbi:MAG: hypothetical protein ACRDTG_14160 [Pseudonocardiaceae bacterium]